MPPLCDDRTVLGAGACLFFIILQVAARATEGTMMKLRLIEQACGCTCTVRGGGGRV